MSKFDRLSVYAVLLASGLALFACRGRQTKDKYTDTATSGFISISADESFRRIVQQEIDVFESIYTMAGIDPIYASEVDAINLLLKDSVRLTVSTRRLTDAEKAGLEEKKFFPKEFKVASDAIALIVNRQNPDSIISLKDLSRILTGEVTEWSELYPGSKLGKLQLVFDNPNSSTVRYAIDSICRGRPLAGSLHAQKSNAEVIDFVSQSPSAIGVIGVSWVGSESDSTNLSFSDRVTVMAREPRGEGDRAEQLQALSGIHGLGRLSAHARRVRDPDRPSQRTGFGLFHFSRFRPGTADHPAGRSDARYAERADRQRERQFII